MKTLIITGGNSQIVKNSLNYLGNFYASYSKVILFTSQPVSYSIPKNFINEIHDYHKDYSLNLVLEGSDEIDLIHTAAATPSVYKDDESSYTYINNEQPKKLVESIKPKLHKIFYISTSSVFDFENDEKIIFEDSPKTTKEKNVYGYSKLLFEEYLNQSGLQYLAIRVPVMITKNVKNNFMSKLKQNIDQKNKISVGFPNELFNSFGYDQDIYKLIETYLVVEYKDIRGSFNISTNNPVSLASLLNAIGIEDFEEVVYPRKPKLISNEKLQQGLGIKLSDTSEVFKQFIGN
jgi:nucleoside-diphosphate-sugar epimerase